MSAQAIPLAGCAQLSCAHVPRPERATTLAAELRAFYAEHSELRPCILSAAELAARFVPHVFVDKPKHAERQIRRANRLLEGTYGERFRVQRRYYGRAIVPPARWIEKTGSSGLSDPSVLRDAVDLRTGDLEQRASADRAGPRRSASRSIPSRPERKARAREPWVSRRRAVPHGVTNPHLLEVAPVDLAGLAALRKAHSGAFDDLADELRRQSYHDHPIEACRAVRTLAERQTTNPKQYLRFFFKRARGGDLLIDGPEAARIADEQERSARAAYAYDDGDPATHWPDLLPEATAGPPPVDRPTIAPRRLSAEAEHERVRMRREAERVIDLLFGATLRWRSPTARFLAALADTTRGTVLEDPP